MFTKALFLTQTRTSKGVLADFFSIALVLEIEQSSKGQDVTKPFLSTKKVYDHALWCHHTALVGRVYTVQVFKQRLGQAKQMQNSGNDP